MYNLSLLYLLYRINESEKVLSIINIYIIVILIGYIDPGCFIYMHHRL